MTHKGFCRRFYLDIVLSPKVLGDVAYIYSGGEIYKMLNNKKIAIILITGHKSGITRLFLRIFTHLAEV